MATVVINIPDAQAAAVRDAFASVFNWDSTGSETKTQFLKRKIAEYVKGIYQGYESAKAAKLASDSSVTATNAVVID